jgi:hypothetical protein
MAPRVHVVGPLTEPQFQPVRRTLATSLGRGLYANARRLTGGLLRPLLSRQARVDAGAAACAAVGDPEARPDADAQSEAVAPAAP